MQFLTPEQARCLPAAIDEALTPEFFRALGDPTRLLLFTCLAKCSRPCSVTELAACCSVDTSVVSRHLKALAEAGWIDSERRGRSVHYAVRYEEVATRLRKAAETIEQCGDGDACCAPDSCC